MFAALGRYKERFGDCNVPQGWAENPRLASWVRIQRGLKTSGKLSRERELRLNAINALTSDQLIAFIERKLKKHGIGKVIPDADTLAKQGKLCAVEQMGSSSVIL
jgi:hypothetical protein